MKITVIGGGSTYTPEIVSGLLARREQLPVTQLWLMDILQQRLDIVGRFAERMVRAAGAPFEVHLTTDRRAAVEGASYVVTQVRVGGMAARREDEYLGQRHGLVGQETTGIGGMAKALRTIPVILQVARDMEELAPDGLLLNFANPAGLVTESITRHSSIKALGVCNGPFSIQVNLLDILHRRGGHDSRGRDVHMDVLGINHLSWQYGMMIDGEDVWDEVMRTYLLELEAGGNGHIPFDAATIRVLDMVPSAYLQYFYYTDRILQQQSGWPPSRAEQVMGVEQDLLTLYQQPDRASPPDDLMKRGGAYYSTVATQIINSHYNDLGEIHAANIRNSGAVKNMPDDWVLETNCRIGRDAITVMPAQGLPLECLGLLTAVKAYELLTVQAAVHGDLDAAYRAMLVHPLGPPADRIEAVLNDLLRINRAYLPQFDGMGVPV